MEDENMGRRILLVEDDVSVAAGIAELLMTCGYEVANIATGAEAEQAVADFRPEVVILDVRLPDIDGRTVFGTLRNRWPQLPVVFSSGHMQSLDEVPADTSRGVTLLHKPYDGDSLLAAVEKVFRDSRPQRAQDVNR